MTEFKPLTFTFCIPPNDPFYNKIQYNLMIQGMLASNKITHDEYNMCFNTDYMNEDIHNKIKVYLDE